LPRTSADSRAAWTLLYPAAFAPHVWQASWKNDVDPLLILSLMRAESLFRHDAVSRVGALGLVQVMPSTGARVASLMGRSDFRVEKLLRPEENIGIGTYYLSKLLDRFQGQFPLAVGAYNGGPHNIGRWLRSKQGIPLEEFIEEIAFDETRKYIKKVVRYYSIYSELYGAGSVVQVPAATRQDDATVINF
jgi:soluble lytic murein transglycosylase